MPIHYSAACLYARKEGGDGLSDRAGKIRLARSEAPHVRFENFSHLDSND